MGAHILVEPWLVPSRPPVSLPEARPRVNSWPPRPPVNRPLPLEELRSPIGTGPVPSPFVKSEGTRNPLNCSSGNSLSSVSFVRSLRISKLISVSRAQPLVPFRKHLRPTWLVYLKTPTWGFTNTHAHESCGELSVGLYALEPTPHNATPSGELLRLDQPATHRLHQAPGRHDFNR